MDRARILIVEDEHLIAQQLSLKLQRFGYDVAGIVTSGSAAIGEAARLAPELVLMDIGIEGDMDGIEAATILHRDYGIPVVYVTASATESTLERVEHSHAYGYILKPFDEREVHATIRLALRRHASSRKVVAALSETQERTTRLRDALGQVSLLVTGTGTPDLQVELRRALDGNALEVHYQPCVSLRSGAIVGVEALVRWNHPRRGLVMPRHLLQVAEAGGFGAALDRWIMERACEQARGWLDADASLKLTLNVTPGNLHAGALQPWLEQLLQRSSIDPGSIELDISESAFLRGVDQSLGDLQYLKALGLKLAVDDFGSGYAAILHLPRRLVDVVKISSEYVRKAANGNNSASVMQALVQLVGGVGLAAVAKGVETSDQLRLLTERGCGFMQGYYFSAAVPAGGIERMLAEKKRLPVVVPVASAPASRDGARSEDVIGPEQQEMIEQMVEQRTRALNESNAELEAFAHAVSHDLRAPLRAIIGFSAILSEEARERLDEEQQRILDRVQQAGNRMAEQIDALLALSRLARRTPLISEVDLSAIANDVLAERLRASPGLALEARVEPGLRVRADPAMLRIALQNLLDNAFKYSSRRPVARIGFEQLQTARGPAYCVSDNGVGFDPGQAHRLFGIFQRLHRQDEFEGDGIGLVSVKRIVMRHGGEVWAESVPGQGAKFFFTLPGEAPAGAAPKLAPVVERP